MSNSTQNWEKKVEDWFVDVVEHDNSEYSYTAKFNSLLALIEEIRADARREIISKVEKIPVVDSSGLCDLIAKDDVLATLRKG